MNFEEKLYFELDDYIRLKRIVENYASRTKTRQQQFSQFLSELDDAEIVPDGTLSSNIVKINSLVKYQYTGDDKLHEIKLVYPADLSLDPGNLSVITPLGIALIGKRKNSLSEYSAPGGIYRIEIKEVHHAKQFTNV
ncbi:MAG: GreA/GreB family elongation factor [Spirochaetales bacterium]|uniref:GreA/GreB family elongation factor n=1 Tax=Candidatus Thalassospirochaeta sargassi TaxID=3119039 RepID=A0AAJ1MJU7_9SPIO|nr:GreA/GreB family elongation factor [Spirochaetales bacterium]